MYINIMNHEFFTVTLPGVSYRKELIQVILITTILSHPFCL